MLTVPLNYSDPTGATIKIAVSRIKHTSSAAKYQGVILTNPGGPGGSGLDLNTFLIAQLKARAPPPDKAAGRGTTGSGSTRAASAPASGA